MAARILVVDDNTSNLDLMLYLLRAFGHEPTAKADGLAGLQAAQNERFDLILCDVLMPGIDGYDFARRIADLPTKPPIIAVTALAMAGDRDRLLAAGFDGYLSKPIDPMTLQAKIDEFLHGNNTRR